jgi:hypothetical protein
MTAVGSGQAVQWPARVHAVFQAREGRIASHERHLSCQGEGGMTYWLLVIRWQPCAKVDMALERPRYLQLVPDRSLCSSVWHCEGVSMVGAGAVILEVPGMTEQAAPVPDQALQSVRLSIAVGCTAG